MKYKRMLLIFFVLVIVVLAVMLQLQDRQFTMTSVKSTYSIEETNVISFRLRNNTEQRWCHGDNAMSYLEQYNNDSWTLVEPREPLVYSFLSYHFNPQDTTIVNIMLDDYELTPGRYRCCSNLENRTKGSEQTVTVYAQFSLTK